MIVSHANRCHYKSWDERGTSQQLAPLANAGLLEAFASRASVPKSAARPVIATLASQALRSSPPQKLGHL